MVSSFSEDLPLSDRSENTTVTTRFQQSLLVAMLVVGSRFSGWGAEPAAPTLRGVFADDFVVGVALDGRVVGGRNAAAAEIAARQFSSLAAENASKTVAPGPTPRSPPKTRTHHDQRQRTVEQLTKLLSKL
jgi:hypothetical protein